MRHTSELTNKAILFLFFVGKSEVIVPPVSNTNSSSATWSNVERRDLIELHTMLSEQYAKPSMKKERGLENCFLKNLTKAFRDYVDHNAKSGNDRRECPFL